MDEARMKECWSLPAISRGPQPKPYAARNLTLNPTPYPTSASTSRGPQKRRAPRPYTSHTINALPCQTTARQPSGPAARRGHPSYPEHKPQIHPQGASVAASKAASSVRAFRLQGSGIRVLTEGDCLMHGKGQALAEREREERRSLKPRAQAWRQATPPRLTEGR